MSEENTTEINIKDLFYNCIFCGKSWYKDPNSFQYCDCDESIKTAEKAYDKFKNISIGEWTYMNKPGHKSEWTAEVDCEIEYLYERDSWFSRLCGRIKNIINKTKY